MGKYIRIKRLWKIKKYQCIEIKITNFFKISIILLGKKVDIRINLKWGW